MKNLKLTITTLIAIVVLTSTFSTLSAQEKSREQIKQEKKELKQESREIKKRERQERKAAKKEDRNKQEILDYDLAMDAIEREHWIIEARSLQSKRGSSVQVDSSTNFISREGDDMYIQIAFPASSRPGANGLGGITLKGRPSNEEKIYDKKGNLTYTLTIKGAAITADVIIRMGASGNYIDAEVKSMFRNTYIRFDGVIVPLSESSHFRAGEGI